MKNRNSITHENCEGFISLTLRTRNLRRPSRVLARNWKHQWLPLCLARLVRTTRIVGMVKNPIKSNQNLRVFWKLVNLQDCVWENHYRLIAMKIPAAKAAVDKEWEKLEKIRAGEPDESQKYIRGDR